MCMCVFLSEHKTLGSHEYFYDFSSLTNTIVSNTFVVTIIVHKTLAAIKSEHAVFLNFGVRVLKWHFLTGVLGY